MGRIKLTPVKPIFKQKKHQVMHEAISKIAIHATDSRAPALKAKPPKKLYNEQVINS